MVDDWVLRKERAYIEMIDTVKEQLEEAVALGDDLKVSSCTFMLTEYRELLDEFRQYYCLV